MAWYRTGTVTVTAGSAIVIGDGTAFVDNVSSGDAFNGPDGRSYEIAAVVSATHLTLASNYQGGSAGGQAYSVQPTSSFSRDLALQATTLLNTFAAVRDGIGQGLIADGSAATPAIRFVTDQDTGIRRAGVNLLALTAGGVDALYAAANGSVGIGTGAPQALLDVSHATRSSIRVNRPGVADVYLSAGDGNRYGLDTSSVELQFGVNGVERARIDGSGNLIVGAGGSGAYGAAHRISRSAPQGTPILSIDGNLSAYSAGFFSVGEGFYSESQAAIFAGRSGNTGRSINAGGTINASGADYAEYMVKSDGCGTIDKGDVCGVDRDGKLTRTRADAVSFVVKSTDPAYVGGDSWGRDMRPRPEAPGIEPIRPEPPTFPEPLGVLPEQPVQAEDESERDFGDRLLAWMHDARGYAELAAAHQAYSEAMAVYRDALAVYEVAHAEWGERTRQYETALPAWEAELETRRVCVDRIAFVGQVPVNIGGDFAVGDYLIAAPNGGGIRAIAIAEANITFEQYRRRIGKVWAVRDGRPWVDVQHG